METKIQKLEINSPEQLAKLLKEYLSAQAKRKVSLHNLTIFKKSKLEFPLVLEYSIDPQPENERIYALFARDISEIVSGPKPYLKFLQKVNLVHVITIMAVFPYEYSYKIGIRNYGRKKHYYMKEDLRELFRLETHEFQELWSNIHNLSRDIVSHELNKNRFPHFIEDKIGCLEKLLETTKKELFS